jgi:hypothetical protein
MPAPSGSELAQHSARPQVTGNRRAAAIGRRAAEALLARELPPGPC